MKKYIALIIVCASIFCLTGCTDFTASTDAKVANKQAVSLAEANSEIGLPNIVNFQEKKLLKMIYELRDQENVVNYAYLYNEYSGKLVYLGECVGYGMPYATQYSNPEKLNVYDTYGVSNIPQAEPNGLFMPNSAAGTWVMLIDPNDKTKQPHPVYVEPNVVISPFKLTI